MGKCSFLVFSNISSLSISSQTFWIFVLYKAVSEVKHNCAGSPRVSAATTKRTVKSSSAICSRDSMKTSTGCGFCWQFHHFFFWHWAFLNSRCWRSRPRSTARSTAASACASKQWKRGSVTFVATILNLSTCLLGSSSPLWGVLSVLTSRSRSSRSGISVLESLQELARSPSSTASIRSQRRRCLTATRCQRANDARREENARRDIRSTGFPRSWSSTWRDSRRAIGSNRSSVPQSPSLSTGSIFPSKKISHHLVDFIEATISNLKMNFPPFAVTLTVWPIQATIAMQSQTTVEPSTGNSFHQ